MSSISNTARSGNVLVLLDLYASGFASSTASPTIPMLTSRTMHTLYAISLLIYSINSLFSWLYLYNLLQGFLTSFALHFWFVLILVVSTVSGSMLIILLVMLCVENAFVHRLDVAERKNGLAFIWEAFSEWLQGFNNFRVGFLFMALHDVPISLANFFLLSACRCSGPQVLRWPLFLSVFGTTLSLVWRLVLLYFAYSRLLFPSKNSNNSGFPSRSQSFRNQIANEQNIQNSLETTNNNNNIYDETCPIQWSSALFYGSSNTTNKGCFCFYCKRMKKKTIYLYGEDPGEKRFLSLCCGFWLSCFFYKACFSLCLSIDQNRQLIHPILMPQQSSLLQLSTPLNTKLSSQCKSLWDFPHPLTLTSKWMPGMARMVPGQWQARIPLKMDGSLMLAVSNF
uniref:Uncharacterized protein n=1 Tax=Meloidogyne hapla TaxID=6305 RepID=A0A1I8BDB8_MELHA